MGFFNRQKKAEKVSKVPTTSRNSNNNNKSTTTVAQGVERMKVDTAATPAPLQETVIRTAGDSSKQKVTTTMRNDEQGRDVRQKYPTSKLAPAGRGQLHGIGTPKKNHNSTPNSSDYKTPVAAPAGETPSPTFPPPSDAVVETSPTAIENESATMASIEVTRELVKGFIAEIWNRGNINLIKTICHPSIRFNGHVGMDRVGHDGFARMVTTVREALTDYHCEIHSMVVESNKAFCRLKFTGKHTGVLLGYPPTGKPVAWVGASEFTCKNGKILKVWELGDVKSLEVQLRSSEV